MRVNSSLVRRHKEREQFARFKLLIKTPVSLGSLQLPAGAILGVSCSEEVSTGDISVSVQGRTIYTPDLAADQIHSLSYLEAGTVVTPTAISGTLSLWVLDGFRKPFLIGTS